MLKLFPLVFLLFTLVAPEELEARRRGYSRSRGSRSSSRSRSYSRSSSSSSRRSSWGGSSYRKKGGLFGSSSKRNRSLGRSSRRSSTSSRRSSTSSRRSSTTSRSSTSRSSSARNTSRRSSRSSSRVSSRPRRSSKTRYVSSTWGSSQPRYRSRSRWWTKRSSRKSRWRSSPTYRYRFRSRYYDTYTPYSSVGIWDVYFLSQASDLFWYHHWNDASIQRALYQDRVLQDAELARLEAKIRSLETQNIVRDMSYIPEGIEPQDMYSEAYIQSVRQDEESSSVGFILFLSILIGAGFAYFFFVRKY